jgi:prophage DNA circulation protein
MASSIFAALGRLQNKLDEMKSIVMHMEKVCVESWSLCSMSTAAAMRTGTGVVSIATQVEAMEDAYFMARDETSLKCTILHLLADALGSPEVNQAAAIRSLFAVFSDAVHIQQQHPSFVLLRLQGS